jgi:exonuclease SbcC
MEHRRTGRTTFSLCGIAFRTECNCMKILAIRGKNLASLADEFLISFSEEPLASAGLFAISGPTGSGKSTLLDALCLALYDDTPRLLKASSKGAKLPDASGETLTPNDTANLLRRSTVDGYAEVDFIGNDQVSYRARWSVRRSNARPDGKLNKSIMSLKRLPELQEIGGTKTEVKAEIVQRIGLNFDQFTRSVLLAQNEFSAFLKADDNERGELLETLTGIVIYTAISKRAYERAKLELAALTRLNDRLADQKPLSLDERTLLDEKSYQSYQALAELEQHKNTLAEQLRWHESLHKAQNSEQQAQAELETRLTENLAAAPRKAEFERIESVQSARSLLADCERIQTEIMACQHASSQGEINLKQATQALLLASEAHNLARQESELAGQKLVSAMPDLDRAKALDVQLETLLPLHREAEQLSINAQKSANISQQQIDYNYKNKESILFEQQATDNWLAEHRQLETLATGWPRWDTLFGQAATLAQDQTRLNTESASTQQNAAQLASAGEAAQNDLNQADQALNLAEIQRHSWQEKLAGFDLNARQSRKLATESRRDLLSVAEQQWRELAAKLTVQWHLQTEAGQLDDTIRQAESELIQLDERLPLARATLSQAERSLKTAEAACAEKVETLRAALEENEACPVCGALDHPYRRNNPQLHAVLDSLQKQVADCRLEVQQLQHQHTTQQSQLDHSRRQFEANASQLLKLNEAMQTAQTAWQAHDLADELADIEADTRADWLVNQQQLVRTILRAIEAEEGAEREAAAGRDQAQTEFDRATKQQATCKDALATALANIALLHAASAAASEKFADTGQRLKLTLSELDGAFENQQWMHAWQNDPGDFYASLKAVINQWDTQYKSRKIQQNELEKLAVAQTALLEAFSLASAELLQKTRAFTESLAQIDTLQTARIALFGSKAVSRIQAELDDAIELAKHKLGSQLALAQHASLATTRCQTALDQAEIQQIKLSQDATTAATALTDWLKRYNLAHVNTTMDLAQLSAWLAYTPDWIINERMQLQAIESDIQNFKSILRERQTQRALIAEIHLTDDSWEVVQETFNLLDIERQTASANAITLQSEIAQDSKRREQSAAMLGDIEKQEVTNRLWAQLNDLIGSADGKKFRNYAQQFTLDVLLGYANQHLAELSRRYRLARIKDTLALMVVDQDMGDEQRSVHSLSGGESFLVSLALALGLASLSSNQVRVESLFIDEGFGSLDPETLSVAMDALDGLQALGRKVGVISHVQEMTERISCKIQVERLPGGKSRVVIR